MKSFIKNKKGEQKKKILKNNNAYIFEIVIFIISRNDYHFRLYNFIIVKVSRN